MPKLACISAASRTRLITTRLTKRLTPLPWAKDPVPGKKRCQELARGNPRPTRQALSTNASTTSIFPQYIENRHETPTVYFK